jgi:hypothetical protein
MLWSGAPENGYHACTFVCEPHCRSRRDDCLLIVGSYKYVVPEEQATFSDFVQLSNSKINVVVLGGVMVIMLVIGPNVRGFKHRRERWSFKGDKIRSTAFFREAVKPSEPCRKIVRHVKEQLRYDRDTN